LLLLKWLRAFRTKQTFNTENLIFIIKLFCFSPFFLILAQAKKNCPFIFHSKWFNFNQKVLRYRSRTQAEKSTWCYDLWNEKSNNKLMRPLETEDELTHIMCQNKVNYIWSITNIIQFGSRANITHSRHLLIHNCSCLYFLKNELTELYSISIVLHCQGCVRSNVSSLHSITLKQTYNNANHTSSSVIWIIFFNLMSTKGACHSSAQLTYSRRKKGWSKFFIFAFCRQHIIILMNC
jgi:hypothetical protein